MPTLKTTTTMALNPESWRFTRFERETRYYELRLQQDLFGWVVVKIWGRTSSRLGQMRTTPCSSFAEASRAWDAGVRARQRRGYVPVWWCSGAPADHPTAYSCSG